MWIKESCLWICFSVSVSTDAFSHCLVICEIRFTGQLVNSGKEWACVFVLDSGKCIIPCFLSLPSSVLEADVGTAVCNSPSVPQLSWLLKPRAWSQSWLFPSPCGLPCSPSHEEDASYLFSYGPLPWAGAGVQPCSCPGVPVPWVWVKGPLSPLWSSLWEHQIRDNLTCAFLLARGAGREPAALAREMGAEDLLGWEGWGALCSGNHGFLMCETTGRSQELGCRSGQTGNWVAGGRQTQELSKVFQGWCSFPGQPHCWPWASGSLVEENLCLCWGLGVVWSTPAREGLSFSAAREELGICVQPADFSPTSLSMHCEALAPSFSVPRNVCMQVTSSGFKCLPSTLDKNRTFL